MNRLRIPRSEIHAGKAVIRGEDLSYLKDVLRLRIGAPLEVFDGEGGVYASTVAGFGDDVATIALGDREVRASTAARIVLLQGLPKADKFELVVQKAAELGVTEVVPVAMERSIVKLDPKKAADRVERWRKIASEAARQSGRADVMEVGELVTFDAAIARTPADGELRLVLDEGERTRRMREVLETRASRYSILIGPEGGITRDEVAAAAARGWLGVSLGPRILRTETAGLAAAAIVQHVCGDLG